MMMKGNQNYSIIFSVVAAAALILCATTQHLPNSNNVRRKLQSTGFDPKSVTLKTTANPYRTDIGATSRKNSLIYVHVPKTGGSTIEHSSLFLDARRYHTPWGHHSIEKMTKDADERGISNFVKAAHIRHPCDRFVSAFAYLKSDLCNPGDKKWANEFIGKKSIDEFVVETENNPDLLRTAHFRSQWVWLFYRDGTFGIDAVLCQETWDESLDMLSRQFNISVPRELYFEHKLLNRHSMCGDLLPETRETIKRIYQMDYCIFGYDDSPRASCHQSKVPPEDLKRQYQVCSERYQWGVQDSNFFGSKGWGGLA